MGNLLSKNTSTVNSGGKASNVTQTATESTRTSETELPVSTVEHVDGQSSTTTETPGKLTTTSTEVRPLMSKIEILPDIISTKVSSPFETIQTSAPVTSDSYEGDDYGFKVTFKINLRNILH